MNVSTSWLSAKLGLADAVVGIVQKYFVHDQSQAMFPAERIQLGAFAGADVRASWIIGMHYNHGARAWSRRPRQRREIDLPAMIVKQRVGRQLHILQVGEELEQGITGLGHQDFIVGIAQQAKNVGVAFAGAGGKHQRVRIDQRLVLLSIVGCHRLACAVQAFGLRIVIHRLGILQGFEDGIRVVVQTGADRIGDGQIEHFPARG